MRWTMLAADGLASGSTSQHSVTAVTTVLRCWGEGGEGGEA